MPHSLPRSSTIWLGKHKRGRHTAHNAIACSLPCPHLSSSRRHATDMSPVYRVQAACSYRFSIRLSCLGLGCLPGTESGDRGPASSCLSPSVSLIPSALVRERESPLVLRAFVPDDAQWLRGIWPDTDEGSLMKDKAKFPATLRAVKSAGSLSREGLDANIFLAPNQSSSGSRLQTNSNPIGGHQPPLLLLLDPVGVRHTRLIYGTQ